MSCMSKVSMKRSTAITRILNIYSARMSVLGFVEWCQVIATTSNAPEKRGPDGSRVAKGMSV
jgi:hypothetical protein